MAIAVRRTEETAEDEDDDEDEDDRRQEFRVHSRIRRMGVRR